MGEFSDVALEIAEEFDGELSEEVTNFKYVKVFTLAEEDWRGIKTAVKQFETDGESVTMTSSKWFCLKHELSMTPLIDDYFLLADGSKHHIARVDDVDNVVAWWVFTNA